MVILVVVMMSALALPSGVLAFDDHRQGFILGLGLGYGSAEQSTPFGSESYSGLATTFKIGGGPSNQLLVYYSNRVVFFSADGSSFYQGMSAAGVSYFLEPSGPSFYFSGELGLGSISSLEDGGGSESGVGITIGAGYEFSPHWVLEVNYMHSSVGDSEWDWSISNFTFAASWLAF